MTEWIRTSYQLPEFNKHVLVFCKIYGTFIASYDRIEDTDWGNWRHDLELGILPPTHWMSLPEPPKSQ